MEETARRASVNGAGGAARKKHVHEGSGLGAGGSRTLRGRDGGEGAAGWASGKVRSGQTQVEPRPAPPLLSGEEGTGRAHA
eukprot:2160966-Pleurochrysis_carterae.AAC.1